jgi:Transposase
MGIDEIYLGKKQKFLTVVSNLETGEPLWFGRERKKETLDEFLGQQLSVPRPGAGKTLVIAEQLGEPGPTKKRQLNQLFALNRRVMKAYLLKESLARLWDYIYEGAMLRYLQSWIDQLCWQRLAPMEKIATMLLNHLEGILNYCKTEIPMGGRSSERKYQSTAAAGTWLPGPKLPAIEGAALGATKTEFVAFRRAANAHSYRFSCMASTKHCRRTCGAGCLLND